MDGRVAFLLIIVPLPGRYEVDLVAPNVRDVADAMFLREPQLEIGGGEESLSDVASAEVSLGGTLPVPQTAGP